MTYWRIRYNHYCPKCKGRNMVLLLHWYSGFIGLAYEGISSFLQGKCDTTLKAWTTKIHPHPTIIKKMKTFLEVENKMGLTIPIPEPNSQFIPHSQKQILISVRMTIQIKEKELHPKGSSDQLPLGLL